MNRRQILRACCLGLSLPCVPLGQTGCYHPATREDVLRALVRDVVLPNTLALAKESERLQGLLTAFAGEPTLTRLRAARAAWKSTSLAWKRVSCFKNGPIVDTNALLRANFWPVRPQAIETAIEAPGPLEAVRIEELGVDVKGMYALEYLLFPLDVNEQDTLASFAKGPHARARFVELLGKDVATHVHKTIEALADGEAYALRFAQGGQTSLSALVNQLIASVETVAFNRLDLVLGLFANRILKSREVEGWPSGNSRDLAQAEVSAVEQLYRGPSLRGISDLVRNVSPQIDERIRARFRLVSAALAKLEGPLESVVQENPALVREARDVLKDLEIAMKVDVASALGVTLTFQMGDGD